MLRISNLFGEIAEGCWGKAGEPMRMSKREFTSSMGSTRDALSCDFCGRRYQCK